ncbi:type II/IV secretion system protein [Candidatus Peregrinibacteria bacterium]|nr:type II/IV secretion system protein [Candidatus Peregrinibacteria bacterium]
MKIDPKKLIQALKEKKVDSSEIKLMTEESKETGAPLYDIVEKRHLFSDDAWGRITADLIGFPFINLSKIETPSEILEIVPENIALKQGVITFGIDEARNVVKIATINPFDLEIIHDIQKKTGRETEVFYTTSANIKGIIGKYHQELKNIFLGMLPAHLRYAAKEGGEEKKERTVAATEAFEEEVPIIKIFDAIMLHAYRHHASDIHLEATKNHTVIRYRIDGVLHTIVRYPKMVHEPLVTRCKILASLRIDETRAAQDGRISVKLDNDPVAFRVSILPTHFGEKIVMRLLVELGEAMNLMDTGLSAEDYKKVIRNSTKPYGMMICVGPTGSGKTTTLYNVIKLLNSDEINIATIEDPIEYGIEGINQVQVNLATNLTFANGLRALLRQDPDSILVGEIRDSDTAQIAIESAMTGHMVFSTLHANSAAVAIPRLIEMGMEPFLLTAALNCIIAQRLVRKLCPHCLKTQVYPAETLNLIYNTKNIVEIIRKIATKYCPPEEIEALNFKNEFIFYKSTGCKMCGFTGYKGRIGIYEVMELDEELKKIILRGGSADEIEDIAEKSGMPTMLESGIEKALSGITSLEEIIRVIKT